MRRKGGCHPGRSHGSMASRDTRAQERRWGGRGRKRRLPLFTRYGGKCGLRYFLRNRPLICFASTKSSGSSQFLHSPPAPRLRSLVTVLRRLSILHFTLPHSSVGKGFLIIARHFTKDFAAFSHSSPLSSLKLNLRNRRTGRAHAPQLFGFPRLRNNSKKFQQMTGILRRRGPLIQMLKRTALPA